MVEDTLLNRLRIWAIGKLGGMAIPYPLVSSETDKIRLGREAQNLLDNIAFKFVCKALEDAYHREWLMSKPEEKVGIFVWYKYTALQDIKANLHGMVEVMKLEKQKIKEKETQNA